MSRCCAVLSAFGLIVVTSLAADLNPQSNLPDDLPPGGIEVHLKGTLMLGTGLKPGLDPDSRPHDDDAWENSSAIVLAGGTSLHLDWNRSDKIRDELLWWRLPRHGDGRQKQAEVTSRMIFKPFKELSGLRINFPEVSEQTPVPVVIVETLHVQLVGPDGKPQGLPERKRVTAE